MGVQRLTRWASQLSHLSSDEIRYQKAMCQYEIDKWERSKVCKLENADWEARCIAKDPRSWAEKLSVDRDLLELEKEAKTYETVDYERYPFSEILSKERERARLDIYFGFPQHPPEIVPPDPSSVQSIRSATSFFSFLVLFVGSLVLLKRYGAEDGILFDIDDASNNFVALGMFLAEQIVPYFLVVAAILVMLLVSRAFSAMMGSVVLGSARGLAFTIRSRGFYWTLKISAWLDVIWNLYNRLV